jgi:hypothetical protein
MGRRKKRRRKRGGGGVKQRADLARSVAAAAGAAYRCLTGGAGVARIAHALAAVCITCTVAAVKQKPTKSEKKGFFSIKCSSEQSEEKGEPKTFAFAPQNKNPQG